ncbi:hypothetical protein RHS01_06017 [Rhizoctonia solani]|uniref:Uncharacterized protein n=1 Tax=Rhizoctonia solani TaxID=456999 RepID=A0A8H7ICH6_9AGAM|nr:hypothetical protein RHS01_06017 [Rhizoctonia solani]
MEIPQFPNGSLSYASKLWEVRAYLLPMKLLRGSSIVGKANLITRRFITSSMVKDVIFNAKPVSDHILFALAKGNIQLTYFKNYSLESSVAPLNASGDAIALATRPLKTVAYPQTMFVILSKTTGQAPYSMSLDESVVCSHCFRLPICYFLVDHCSGGWSLPRLQTPSEEEYHIQSTEEGTDTIHIVKFLRDFVIDFGPANLDSESHALQQSRPSSPRAETREESAAEAQTSPLMRAPAEDESSLGETKPIDDQSYPNKAVRRNSI